jgi:hypothetical protein
MKSDVGRQERRVSAERAASSHSPVVAMAQESRSADALAGGPVQTSSRTLEYFHNLNNRVAMRFIAMRKGPAALTIRGFSPTKESI